MYKMVAIDLDDTLLTDDLIISPGTVRVIQKVVELGTIVTIATGRMFPSAKPFAKQLGLNIPLITYHGAIIKDIDETSVMYERLLSSEISRKIIQICQEKKIHIQVYQDDILYASSENRKLLDYSKMADVPYTIEPNLANLAVRGFTKVLIIDEPAYLDVLQQELQNLFEKQAHITKSKAFYLEITHPEANKGIALLHLAQELGIDRSEIIGIGDGYNDFDLIKASGLGVAMGNGIDDLKEIAEYTSLSNNEEGVRHVIEKFILKPAGAAIEYKSQY